MLQAFRDGRYHSELAETHVPGGHTSGSHRTHGRHNQAVVYVRKMVKRAGEEAGIGFPCHPHMLRHSAGYKLANDQQDTRAIQHYMGHRNIQHTVRYTELAPDRFKDFWKD